MSGDPDAWERVLAAYRPVLEGVIRRTCARYRLPDDPGRIDDLVQETFLSLIKNDLAALRSYDASRPLGRYLRALAAHRTVDLLRSRGAGTILPESAARERLAGDMAQSVPPEAHRAAETAEDAARLAEALERLDPRDRLVVRLFYWQALPAEAIGRFLHLTPPGVATILFRARRKLSELLKSKPPPPAV